MESQGKTAAIVTLIVGLLVGGAIGWAVAHNTDSTDMMSMNDSMSVSEDNPNAATKAADLRANLVDMGVEHMDLTYAAVASTLQGTKSAQADGAALYKNGTDIGAAVGSVYGKDAETTFNKVWKLHLDQFVAYATAASKNDEAGKKMALNTIDSQYTKPLAAYLAKANPNLPEGTLYKGLKAHVDMTAVMIDDEAKGDYMAADKLRDEGADHLRDLFSTLAEGIVKQFPDKF
ncbi:MAG TPA: hypothetical protein VL362_00060 [Patescibacteria group bacterium]|jgi:hypothetical protein|nr:hypothetical protein [Patescibacteria group bacterium]